MVHKCIVLITVLQNGMLECFLFEISVIE